jgi:flagellar basal-body rod protein FlgG
MNVLGINKSGLKAIQNKMDAISDDLANINTTGYKRKEISFQELVHNTIEGTGFSINAGSKSSINTINFKQGTVSNSPNMMDMAIEGDGFFGIRDANGNLYLSRNGSFKIDGGSNIVDGNGYFLEVSLNMPIEQWGKVDINAKGEIFTDVDGEYQSVGRIILYMPEILDSLTSIGEGKFLPSQNVTLRNSLDSDEGFGDIAQYSLENSNVDVTRSMAEMITAQRAYSLNSKSIQTTDDIISIINNIK